MNSLELLALNNFPLVEPGDDLPSIIFDSIKNNKLIINDNDIVVIAQKIVSKAENRYVNLKTIEISEEAKELSKKLNKDEGLVQAIINESNRILSTKKNVIIVGLLAAVNLFLIWQSLEIRAHSIVVFFVLLKQK